jgi:hypothetical protein
MKAKFSKKMVYGTLMLMLWVFSSCKFYKTVPLDNTAANITNNINNNKTFIIHSNDFSKDYMLVSPRFENEILSGTIINLPEGRSPDLTKEAFPRRNAKTYNPKNVVHIQTVFASIALGESTMKLSEIQSLSYNEVARGRSTLATAGVVTGATVVGLGTFLAIACNCPEVSSFNAVAETKHGNLFPGSVLNSLERDDYVLLEKAELGENNELNLRIANVTAETQYLNQLEILEVEHTGFEYVALTDKNDLVAYNKAIPPINAIENESKNVSDLFLEKDGESYQFDNIEAEKLNEVVLKFDKSTLSDNPALVIYGQQSKWLDTVAMVMLSQAGNYQEKWTNNNDTRLSAEKWKNENKKRGLSLNVYFKKENKWKYVGTYHDVGTSHKRTILMPLDLSGLNGDMVEIKLESAFKIWEIDYAGLTDNWSTELKTTALKLNHATNENGENITAAIASTDEEEVVQNQDGFVEINATTSNTKESTLVLHGFGYYHKHSDFDNNINWLFFAKFKQKMGLHDVSKALYQYSLVQ